MGKRVLDVVVLDAIWASYGSVTEAARAIGMHKSTFYARLHEAGVTNEALDRLRETGRLDLNPTSGPSDASDASDSNPTSEYKPTSGTVRDVQPNLCEPLRDGGSRENFSGMSTAALRIAGPRAWKPQILVSTQIKVDRAVLDLLEAGIEKSRDLLLHELVHSRHFPAFVEELLKGKKGDKA